MAAIESSFESLVYESDISESSESVKSTKSRAGRRSTRRRNSISSESSQPKRRSLRISTLIKTEPNDDHENMKKNMPDLDGEHFNLSDTKLGHENEFEDIKILGATEVDGQLKFIFKWKQDDTPKLISNNEAKTKYPFILMAFYESCMVWDVDEQEVEDADDAEDK